MARRDKVLLSVLAAALLGILVLLALLGWYLWRESVLAEEARLEQLSQRLGEQTERAIVDARDLLDRLNRLDLTPCSPEHLEVLQNAAIARPHVRAIGYWHAVERQCGAGYVQGQALTPPRASRIYDSGVIAWWPGPATAVGGVELFLMRFGQHDLAIDPRLLMTPGLLEDAKVGLWVEDLSMAVYPLGVELPEPGDVRPGLTVDRANNQIVSRFSLGTVFPIDVVAVQPIGLFWERYLPTLVGAGFLGLLLAGLWLVAVLRYLRQHLSLSTELQEAIANDRLSVVYQPIVDLGSRRCQGAEALVRWHREGDESVSPDVFVPLAEASGQATELTLSVLRRVLRDLGKPLRQYSGLIINLNLTAQDLATPRFAEALAELQQQEGVSPASIKLEITERALLNSDEVRERIAALRARGHPIAIDDFGTGYSSLAYLERFQLDTLKIDKAFVDGIEGQAVASSVIGHIIDMARSLRLDIVAEGIESEHQVDWLRQQGVQFGQGYLFSPPLPAAKFRNWCNRR
ncbi:EAL domain-containing protein [Thioalkalivibrio paradoxus]|uniref:cyclic-guanylate-specific phosphodiesterase n=1 Tax=Thioalkalivibrio paradoxus ARh 1 TaxID=713585 RepID=W0DKN2_9GAMM|nr:EAL domain-containing protein [Thioalkalivibrio paradoxus]AHE99144.1 signal peptide protein [Thioalkalivibrio paradoxus ARh 1]